MRHTRTRTRRPGVAAAELAILLPFLALLFIAAADFCRVFHASQIVTGAAHAGALAASGSHPLLPGVTPEQAAREAALAETTSLQPPVQPDDITIATTGNDLTVTVQYEFTTLTGYPALPGRVTITRTVLVPNIRASEGATQ